MFDPLEFGGLQFAMAVFDFDLFAMNQHVLKGDPAVKSSQTLESDV